jgi:hypothetical protein
METGFLMKQFEGFFLMTFKFWYIVLYFLVLIFFLFQIEIDMVGLTCLHAYKHAVGFIQFSYK